MARGGRARKFFCFVALLLVFAVTHAKKSKRWTYPRCVPKLLPVYERNLALQCFCRQTTYLEIILENVFLQVAVYSSTRNRELQLLLLYEYAVRGVVCVRATAVVGVT